MFVSAGNRRIVPGMASGQQFLFAPEQPLVERLGKTFFRRLPRRAGIYKMHDARGSIVYVGKAKDLRRRLGSYRVANPEHMGRRQLRLLQAVARIEIELCGNEAAALKQEARLIRKLRPKFNRAGVWPGKPQFLAWRFSEQALEFSIQETPLPGWERFGSLGAYAPRMRAALARLLWLAMNPGLGFSQLPPGWPQGRLGDPVAIPCGARVEEVKTAMAEAFWGSREVFITWLARSLNSVRPPFERAAIARDMEEIGGFFEHQRSPGTATRQMALL